MCPHLFGDPNVSTLTHNSGSTAQEQCVVPQLSHSIAKGVKSAGAKHGSNTSLCQNKSLIF